MMLQSANDNFNLMFAPSVKYSGLKVTPSGKVKLCMREKRKKGVAALN